MPGAAVSLVLTADEPASRRAAGDLFPGVPLETLARAELRPRHPFVGRLFERLAAVPEGACVGLVVPVASSESDGGSGRARSPSVAPSADLLAIADHVNLELRGPLTGRWPTGVPRRFPPMSRIYQPAVVRALDGARVYSAGVVVAGVADVDQLSPFEVAAIREGGFPVVSDRLVSAAIIAAYHGLTLAACGVPPAPACDRE